MDTFLADVRSRYGDDAVTIRKVGTVNLVRISPVQMPRRRGTTSVLVELPEGFRSNGVRPGVYVAPGTTQPNGRPGKNVNSVIAHGEPWLSFSWQFPWDVTMPGWTLVEGALRRFAQDED
jgi:hypothetical protein